MIEDSEICLILGLFLDQVQSSLKFIGVTAITMTK